MRIYLRMATMSSRSVLSIAVVVSVVALVIAAVIWGFSPSNELQVAPTARIAPHRADQSSPASGGSDLASPVQGSAPGGRDATSPGPSPAAGDPGRVAPVPVDANPSVALVAEALRTHEHPERLSALIAPKPFNREAYLNDPNGYATLVEPGRALQSATPGPGVPKLAAVGPTVFSTTQDGELILRVRTQPGMPTTFTSFDLGRFRNQLASQTVIADAQGVAAVAWTAGPGTIDAVRILAGSPVASGQVTFDVQVAHSVAVNAAPTQSR